VHSGEIFALLGPNGAGKTTVVRMLLRILHPDRGTIRYHLNESSREQVLPHEIGYLPEERGLYREISVHKNLAYMGVLRGLKRKEAMRAAEEWLERLELHERKNEKLDQLSKGNQQKVQFIASILHRPKFAILDEPFSGLDPVNQEFFIDLIRELRASGMTILLSAHQMDLVQRLADRVLLLHRGRSVLEGTIAQVRASPAAFKKVVLKIEGAIASSQFERFEAVAHLDKLAEGEYAFLLRKGASMSSFLTAASAHLDISDIRSEYPSLHEIFLRALNVEKGA
jgi:ABC-2 type transport system ATP-binding protein